MATTTTRFKLTELNGLTRSVIFPDKPTWHTLSAKINLLYGIPIERVSVFYIDNDNDQVTLSSQQELDDFYANFHQPHANQAIKFTVQDLTTARLRSTSSQTPKAANIRNTFGIDIEDDWQTLRIPQLNEFEGLFGPQSFDDPPRQGFVETVPSDAGSFSNPHDDRDQHSVYHSSMLSRPDSPFLISLDKGKEKATYEDNVSLTCSAPIVAESTPKVNTQTVHPVEPDGDTDNHPFKPDAEMVTPAGATEDPPLPSMDEDAPSPMPSLSGDIASLLNAFSSVVAMHPELSEGVRNIVRSASSGTYWHAHRDAISRAAHDIAQETGRATETLRRETENEAGRRVAEALDGIFCSLSRVLGGVYVPSQSTTSQVDDGTVAALATGANDASSTCNTSATHPALSGAEDPVVEQQPHHLYPHFNPWTHRGAPFSRWGQRVPQPPAWGPPREPYAFSHCAPPPPPPPPPPPAMPGSWQGLAPVPGPPSPPSDLPVNNKPSPQELRAQVDAAKARYKAEKERYRKERDERRKERERDAQKGPAEMTAIPGAPPPLPPPPPPRLLTSPAIAVPGKSGNTTREVVSLHRNHTHLGHGYNIKQHHHEGDVKSRAVHRITRRLADMGFTENAHPNLPSKIKTELPSDGSLTKEGEDNIVTTLLEDLLAASPKPPVASGSGSKEIPGAWR